MKIPHDALNLRQQGFSRALHLPVLLLVLEAHCAWGVEIPIGAPARIGPLGEPERLSFEGQQTFPVQAIRRALRSDLDYLAASHPEATPAECLAALEDRVRAGYREGGFPEAAVQARFDLATSRIVAKITEGPHFRCGPLRVTGLRTIPVADFTRQFAKKLAPASPQATPDLGSWHTGTPVSFTPESLANYSAAASNTFAALGRFTAVFKVEIQPQPASGDAALLVVVSSEGPAAVLRDIEVVGNKKNRRDDVLAFLGLSKGMEITQDLITEKTRLLTQAARFADCSITPTILGPKGQVSLLIRVVETDRLPPLKKAPSREEKTLLRLREWLLAWESRQEDLMLSWSQPATSGQRPQRIEVILAPSGGILARVSGKSPAQEQLQDLYSMIVRTDALALYAQTHQRKLDVPLPTGYGGVFFVKLGAASNSPSGFSMTLGAGLSPAQTNTGWQLRLDLLPAAFIDQLYRPETKATWQGQVLTVRAADFIVRVEEETGRLLEAGSIGDQMTTSANASGAYRMAVRFEPGAFAKAADQIAASTRAHPDAYQSQRAVGSALGFMAAELTLAKPLWTSAPGSASAEPPAVLASALEKLLAGSLLDPLQALLIEAKPPGGDQEFTIPTRPRENQDSVRQEIESLMVWCAGHAYELAPADSWLQTILREAAFTLTSRIEHTQAALARLAAQEDLGPIGCFVALHALLWSNQDSWVAFRDRGLRRLATEDVRRDYRMLLDPGSVMTRCLANLARELGTLTKPEIEAIAALFPPDGGTLVGELAGAMQDFQGLSATNSIGPALERWWNTTARGSMEADFRFHVQRPARKADSR